MGVASGESCAEIAENAMDFDSDLIPMLSLENGIHMIQPKGLPAKATICEFDFRGQFYYDNNLRDDWIEKITKFWVTKIFVHFLRFLFL